jgi:hypothetical protein
VNQLLTKTLGWNRDDVSSFKDSPVLIKNLYDRIDNEIKDLKSVAKRIAKFNAQHLNVFAFIGHGVINEKNEALFLVNSKNDEGKIEIKTINVDQLAKNFAEIKNTMTIILFAASRIRSTENFD